MLLLLLVLVDGATECTVGIVDVSYCCFCSWCFCCSRFSWCCCCCCTVVGAVVVVVVGAAVNAIVGGATDVILNVKLLFLWLILL